MRQHYIATRISRSAIFCSVSPCSSLRVSRKVQGVGLVHYQVFEPQVPTFGKPARAESCWIELGRTVRSSDACRIVVMGVVSHDTGNGGLQDFPGVADVIHWTVADRDPGAGPRSGAGMAFSSRPRPHFTNWPGFCGRDPGRRSPVWCRDSILIPAPAKLKNWPGFWPGIYHLQYKIANYF